MTTCNKCDERIEKRVEKALSGELATVWTGIGTNLWACPVDGNEHTPQETFTVFEVEITQEHVKATSAGTAAAQYLNAHPNVQHIRVLSDEVGEDGDWFDTAQHLTDAETFDRGSLHDCEHCGSVAFDGECTSPTCPGGNQ